MPRSTAHIDAEIAVIETRLAAADHYVRSGGSDGTSITHEARSDLEKRLDRLYIQKDRLDGTAPMVSRGRLAGL